jgi:hypothetical protein
MGLRAGELVGATLGDIETDERGDHWLKFVEKDEDYRENPDVGAEIGPDAIRKGLQAAYRDRSTLLHLHSHGGSGTPRFSQVDLEGGDALIPSFCNVIPQMPHGMLVLSDDSARGVLWNAPKQSPQQIAGFVQIGMPFRKFGEAA